MSDPAPPDRAAAEAMWIAYAATAPDRVALAPEFDVERFGDSAELADELLGLVVSGRKRATAGLVADYSHEGQRLPRIGGHWIACDGAGVPRVILRSVELRIGELDSVDEAFAWDEGEGDRTRSDWLEGHRRYFTRTLAARGSRLEATTPVVFERFRVVWPPEHAD